MENITSIVFVITRDGFWFAEKFLDKTNIQRILTELNYLISNCVSEEELNKLV